MIDPVTIELVLKAAEVSHEVLKEIEDKQEVIDRLSKIQSSFDQLIFREIVFSYEALSDALATSNQETKRFRLNVAEENLLKTTGLDSSLSTSGIPNSRLMALAHFGLAFICTLRGDDAIAAIHCLRVYKSDPNYARKDLLPKIYTTLFEPKCADIFLWYDTTRESYLIGNYKPGMLALATGLIVSGPMVGLLASLAIVHPSLYDYKRRLNSIVNVNPLKIVETSFNSKIDDRCRELATNWLDGK